MVLTQGRQAYRNTMLPLKIWHIWAEGKSNWGHGISSTPKLFKT